MREIPYLRLCPTRRKELRESHAIGAQGEKELPDETELPDEKAPLLELPTISLGECNFPSHTKKYRTYFLSIYSGDVAGPSESLASTQLHYDEENSK